MDIIRTKEGDYSQREDILRFLNCSSACDGGAAEKTGSAESSVIEFLLTDIIISSFSFFILWNSVHL